MGTTGEVGEAYREMLDAAAGLDARWAEVISDEQSRLEGYRWALSLISAAHDVFITADPGRPRFVDIVGPYRKFNGDNPDAYYQFAPLDPGHTYRVTGRRGDSVYMSVTVYGTALDAETDRMVDTDRIVGTINDRDLTFAEDGTFTFYLGPERPEGWDGVFLRLTPESVCAITRDYLADAPNERRAEWRIEAVDGPATHRLDETDMASRFRAAARWIRRHGEMFPSPMRPANTVDQPYPVPSVTRGWAAGDAAYAAGAFELGDDQAMVVRGRSPECVFWNLVLWNPFISTYNYEYRDTEPVSINSSRIRYEDDGSWTIVIAPRDPGHPNWVSTAGHRSGMLWFRWFLPEAVPERPTVEVVDI